MTKLSRSLAPIWMHLFFLIDLIHLAISNGFSRKEKCFDAIWRAEFFMFHDFSRLLVCPHRWPQMWYLNRGNRLDMNVQEAWQEGATGKGISITILDDGIERTHPDIQANYDPYASFDVNQNDNDPTPRYDITDSNRHGRTWSKNKNTEKLLSDYIILIRKTRLRH